MNRQRKSKIIAFILVGTIGSLLILFAVMHCVLSIEDNYTLQLKQSLSDVSEQYSDTLLEQINSRYNLLRSVTAGLETSDNIDNKLKGYRTIVDAFDLKRIGVVDLDGTVHTTDNSEGNLTYRDFFKNSMEGKTYISNILEDALLDDREKVIVMSMPIYDKDGEIRGVSCLTFKTSVLSKDLNIKSFEGYGDNFVINRSGEVIVSSNTDMLDVSERVTLADIDITDHGDSGNVSFAETIVRESYLDGMFTINDKDYYFMFTPVRIMSGNDIVYILSTVQADYVMAKYSVARNGLIRLVLIVVFIELLCFVGIRQYYRGQRRMTYTLAYTSAITGGPNLSRFFDNLKNVKSRGGYIIFMNLEDFAHTSVATGIEKSNELIKDIWDVIKYFMKHDEYAGHIHGDSFVLYFNETSNIATAERLQKLRDLIHDVGHSNDIPWVFPKFGVCRMSEENDAKTAYSKAEYTVFDTWGSTKCVSFYSDEDHAKQALNKDIEEQFESAILEERFEVWYQPKYNLKGNKMTGAEALVRWRKNDGTLVPPGIFIPLLEKNGEIAKLDEYVFRHTCAKIREWKNQGYVTVPVSVNVSRATLYRDKIVETYLNIISQHDLEPKDVQIEVTETVVGGNENILDLLTKFRKNGIKILMDDFGTGYSSLSTLGMKCFDTLKIDKSLVDEIRDEYGRIIINQTIQMGYELGLYITVEGVEEKEQLELLNETKCDDIQGYLFSKPLPSDEFEEKIKNIV